MKIDRKINLFFTAIIVMLSVLLAVSFISFEYNQLNKSMNERGQIIIDDLAANLEFPLFIRNLEEAKKIIDKASMREGVVYCVLADNGGNTLYVKGDENEKSVKIYKKTVLKRASMGQGEEMVLGIESETNEPLGLLSLSLSTMETQKAVSFMLMMTVTITLFAILMASIISGFLIKRMLGEPIGLLVKSTQQIARGDFSHKVPIESKDEIGMLAGAFNDMTFKLSTSLVSKDYMESIFASMAETLLVTNVDGNIEMVNDAAVKMLGMKREELTGKPVTAFFDGVTLSDAGNSLINVENWRAF